MGVALQCVFEKELPGLRRMEGKALAIAYCGDAALGQEPVPGANTNIIAIDFKAAGKGGPVTAPTPAVLAPLDPFVSSAGTSDWHDPEQGLTVVREILARLGKGVSLAIVAEFPFGVPDDRKDLVTGLRADLERLGAMLVAARAARTKFRLVFTV